MGFLKKFFDALGSVNFKYVRNETGEQKLNINIKDENDGGGELSVGFGNNKSPTINARLGTVPNKKEEV